MLKNNRLEARRKSISKDIDIFVKQSLDIVDRIHEILIDKNLEQKDLAKLLNKAESEISKWMRGTHNFTLKTISKIEAVLGETIIHTTKQVQSEKKIYVVISNAEYSLKHSKHYSELPVNFEAVIKNKYQRPGDNLN